MANREKILVIDNSLDVTGALKSISRVAHDLSSFFEFSFVIPKKSNGDFWLRQLGFKEIFRLPMIEISKNPSNVFLYLPYLLVNAFQLSRILKKQKISIIHVNDVYNLLAVAIRIFGNSKPYVCHVRFLPNRFPVLLFRSWLALHLKFSKKIIAVSKSVVEMMPTHANIVLVYNELPITESLPENLTPFQQNHFAFLYLSNFMVGKGHNYALLAFAQIHETIPQWTLRFVGGDMGLEKNKKYIDDLKKQSQILNIEQKVEWIQFTHDIEKEYKHADVVLNFSESESFSMTCAEALFFGRPLIATNCGGPAEIIDNGVSGILVPNRDVKEMAKAMKILAAQPEMRSLLGASGRILIREKYSVEKTSFKIKEIYQSILRVEDASL